ncbi:hypothetical protein C6501_11235 [Candidatus Poribacteria bacterium]|nr:MAG: hypothetical protein C6501_11235 [Candidatus Poribacteria bacterium]
MSRQSRNQSAHDNRVRTLANQLRNEGWKVQADLPNFNQPDPIGKDARIPDILATRGEQIKIIEVETPTTLDSHQEQHSTFKRSAAQRENAEFELVVTKPRKS